MIGKLKGIVDTKTSDYVIIDVSGVGYVVFCSNNTLSNVPSIGESVVLYIETHVREDLINLYGFASLEEKRAFLTLNKVSGVGTKMAIAILSALSPEKLSLAIAAEDKSAFKPISGVGPKLANRLITELKDKFTIDNSTSIAGNISNANNVEGTSPSININSDINDAVMALVNLGYNRSDSYHIIANLASENDNYKINDLIKEGLKKLASS